MKCGVTKGFTADFTYNTDFAQVEADLQQVNLTRFSLYFPEKRDFFLDNSRTFAFASATGTDDAPAVFYSRRIGLAESLTAPIVAGGRLSGSVGEFNLGLLDIQTDDVAAAGMPTTNFSVVRLQRNILRRPDIGFVKHPDLRKPFGQF